MTGLRRAATALAIAASACDTPSPRSGQPLARETPCDSSRAARVALDSLARLDPFPSAVLRFARDSAGTRIVTWPDRRAGATVVDGMAIVRVTPSCRIASIVQTDSA
jgi:hypothetical protein